eukprot:8435242-Alexandrium_andersonii.AAC.1
MTWHPDRGGPKRARSGLASGCVGHEEVAPCCDLPPMVRTEQTSFGMPGACLLYTSPSPRD